MKTLLKNILINTLLLYLISAYVGGISIRGGLDTYIISASILTFMTLFLEPIVKILTIPFTLLTLGLFSFLTTLLALFATSLIYKPLTVGSFTFNGLTFLGLNIEKIFLSTLLSFIVISATIYFLNRFINWLFRG